MKSMPVILLFFLARVWIVSSLSEQKMQPEINMLTAAQSNNSFDKQIENNWNNALVVLSSVQFKTKVVIRNGGQIPEDPFFKIRGPFDTGTNFIAKLLAINGIDVHGGSAYLHDESDHPTGGWKHWPLQWEPANMKKPNRFNVLIARHPLSWFLSLDKATYDIKCENFDGSAPCKFELWHVLDKTDNPNVQKALGGKGYGFGKGYVDFDSVVDIWNLYYRGYINTDNPSVIVRYEDFLTQPEEAVRTIGDLMGVPVSNFQQFTDAAKGDTISRTFDEAYDWNINRKYMDKYTQEQINLISSKIDHDVLAKLGYTLN